MKELRAACRKISEPGVDALRRILTETVIDEQGNVRNAHEGKTIVAAMQIALQWGYGKPPDYDPAEDEAGVRINLSVLTSEQKRNLLAALRAGVLTQESPLPDDAASAGPEIQGVIVADKQPIRED